MKREHPFRMVTDFSGLGSLPLLESEESPDDGRASGFDPVRALGGADASRARKVRPEGLFPPTSMIRGRKSDDFERGTASLLIPLPRVAWKRLSAKSFLARGPAPCTKLRGSLTNFYSGRSNIKNVTFRMGSPFSRLGSSNKWDESPTVTEVTEGMDNPCKKVTNLSRPSPSMSR